MVKVTQKNQAKPAVSAAPKADDSEMLTLVKDAFKASRERDLQLSDNVLAMVIDRAKTWDDMSDTDKLDLLEKAEETSKAVSVTDPGITTLINKMDQAFHAELNSCIAAVRKGKTTAVDILAQFRRVYTKAELDGMPMPGTEKEQTDGTNYRPDKVKTTDQTGNPVTTTWTNDFADGTAEGKAACADIDDVGKEKKAAGSVARFKGKTKSDLAAILSAATQDRNAIRSMFKRAIKLHHRWSAIEMLPNVGIMWTRGNKEKGISMPTDYGAGENGKNAIIVTTSPKPIWIYASDNPAEGRDFSVTQVLAFQPDLARHGENGGNMADLVATAGKGAGAGDVEGDGDGTKMADDAAQATASQFYNWINIRENKALVLKKIADRAKDADGKDWLDLMGSIYLAVKPLYEKNKAAYEELQTKEEPTSAAA